MGDSVINTYSALDARMKIVDVITNNLANANTTGFKRDFGHILQDETGAFDIGTQVDLSAGDLVSTGNELDVAINGSGSVKYLGDPKAIISKHGSGTVGKKR